MGQQTESFSSYLGTRMRVDKATLSSQWLARLEEVLSVDRNEIFPTQKLLDHIPRLFAEIGEDLQTFESNTHFTHSLIIEKAKELGELRFEQQASVHQLLREYTILASVLEEFIAAESQQLEVQPPLESVLRTIQRINHDVRSIMQTTVDTFVHRYTAKIADQHERLQSFNRLISHELRKPIQAILSNAELLCLDEQTGATMRSRAVIIRQEVQNLSRSLRNLEQITVVGEATPDNLTLQEVDLQSIVKDIFNQAREDAESRAVDLRMGPLPDTLKVETSKLDLVLRNLIDNGIKYSDPRKNERFIEIYQLSEDADSEHVTLCVRDNGIGIPADKLNEIFTRFGRAHANADDVLNVTGYGIGLSVVKEELNRMNGTIEVESEVDKGTRFLIRLPRQTDTTRIILPGSDTDQ